MRITPLLRTTDRGLYCAKGDFYVDPILPVNRALITHAHADHAIRGHNNYLTQDINIPILKQRLGQNITIQGIAYNTPIHINQLAISFHPAGHIPGSAQIKIKDGASTWVVSGDYKTVEDGISSPFEIQKCDVFISESTFAKPIFKWPDPQHVKQEILDWIRHNQSMSIQSIIFCYSLGKAQRLQKLLSPEIDQILVHPKIAEMNKALQKAGILLPKYRRFNPKHIRSFGKGQVIMLPPASRNAFWVQQLKNVQTANCTGWIMDPTNNINIKTDKTFVLSDHADWNELLFTIENSEAKKVLVTHGYSDSFVNYLGEKAGMDAEVLEKWSQLKAVK